LIVLTMTVLSFFNFDFLIELVEKRLRIKLFLTNLKISIIAFFVVKKKHNLKYLFDIFETVCTRLTLLLFKLVLFLFVCFVVEFALLVDGLLTDHVIILKNDIRLEQPPAILGSSNR